MNKSLKWLGILLGGILGIALIGLLGYFIYWQIQARQTIEVDVAPLEIPTDQASIDRGQILVEIVRCTECHGKDLSGIQWAGSQRPILTGAFGPSNLTPGENGLENYTDEDYVRAIRHGVGQDGKALIYMPSNFYVDLNESDLGDIIAYLKTLPPSDEPGPPNNWFGPLLWDFVLSNPQGLPAIKMIDHEAEREIPTGPDPGDTLAYGEYLALPCRSCHGDDFAGVPMLERLGVPSPNITPYNLGDWTEEDFFTAMREGAVPDGTFIPQSLMPWTAIGQLTDEELHAIWVYLQSLPAVTPEDAIEFQTSEG